MNILPKKRWHVRTKENIARVRRDEAKAAEEEKAKEDRRKLAEKEARTELLRQKARCQTNTGNFIPLNSKEVPTVATKQGHINFFQEVEDGTAEYKKINNEHEKEKKEEQEKYEKQIGYLTYLGQDTNESLGKKNWYDVLPDRSVKAEDGEVNLKSKLRDDPLKIIKKYTEGASTSSQTPQSSSYKNLFPISNYKELSVKRKHSVSSEKIKLKKQKHKHKKDKKSKKHRKSSSESSEDEAEKTRKLAQLRSERLQREQEERRKAEILLKKLSGDKSEEKSKSSQPLPIKQKYNSQFNPELAKQNYD